MPGMYLKAWADLNKAAKYPPASPPFAFSKQLLTLVEVHRIISVEISRWTRLSLTHVSLSVPARRKNAERDAELCARRAACMTTSDDKAAHPCNTVVEEDAQHDSRKMQDGVQCCAVSRAGKRVRTTPPLPAPVSTKAARQWEMSVCDDLDRVLYQSDEVMDVAKTGTSSLMYDAHLPLRIGQKHRHSNRNSICEAKQPIPFNFITNSAR